MNILTIISVILTIYHNIFVINLIHLNIILNITEHSHPTQLSTRVVCFALNHSNLDTHPHDKKNRSYVVILILNIPEDGLLALDRNMSYEFA